MAFRHHVGRIAHLGDVEIDVGGYETFEAQIAEHLHAELDDSPIDRPVMGLGLRLRMQLGEAREERRSELVMRARQPRREVVVTAVPAFVLVLGQRAEVRAQVEGRRDVVEREDEAQRGRGFVVGPEEALQNAPSFVTEEWEKCGIDPHAPRLPRRRRIGDGKHVCSTTCCACMNEELARVHAELGRPRTNLVWAKAELFLGLSAAGIAIAMAPTSPLLSAPLFACGGYLALAGHRSHLYDAMSRQTAATWRELERRG